MYSLVPKSTTELNIAIIGLGYVGLPLAVAFAKKRNVVGYDLNSQRIESLKLGHDSTNEVDKEQLQSLDRLRLTSDPINLDSCNCYIVTVPTPIDDNKQPDLGPLKAASLLVAGKLKKGDIVIYESTVYPGATENDCVPILENYSGLQFNQDFFCGYSPERINPGDKEHKIHTIKKVTSGSTPEVAEVIDSLYKEIISAGTFKASSIQVAEAAKVIENTQRDINIALVNEFKIIFDRMGIDAYEVLEAAKTKWNFLPFEPGLVGGHCIGVDPYYLTHQAQKFGYHPEVILAGRRLNDNMSIYIASQFIKSMIKQSINVKKAHVLMMGLTFKENCPDIRNTKVVDVINELESYGVTVDVFDPLADQLEVKDAFDIECLKKPKQNHYDGLVIAVRHDIFRDMEKQMVSFCKKNYVICDLKKTMKSETKQVETQVS